MAKNYKDYAYFENRPDVVKIFDDLDKLLDFCRFEMLPFNEADLYNRMSPIWNQYYQSTRPRKPWNGEKKPWTGERKPYQGTKPRYNNDNFSR
jgi:hypothetical protein